MSTPAPAPAPAVDADWAEREYNPRLRVPEAPAIYARWPERAASTRARHPPIEIRYGDHPRETLDLFRAPGARATAVFIHGGYWRAFSKDDFSWIAEDLLDQGITVALPSYPLCPDVTLARICAAARGAFAHLWREALTEGERTRIVVSGHSAGGYLSALHLATDWKELGLPADPIAGIMPISGIFRLAPLIATTMNQAIGLDAEQAAALSLHDKPWRSRAAVTLVAGGDESSEFHRQSDDLAEAWAELSPARLSPPGRNHFDVIEGVAERGSDLQAEIFRMLDRGAG